MGLTLSVCPDKHGAIVRVGGEIDICVAQVLEDCLLRVMRTHDTRLLLDLSDVTFFDCAGLRALVQTRRRAEMRNGSAHLIEASAPVRRIIDLTRMADVFPIHDPIHDGRHDGQHDAQDEGVRVMAGGGDDTWTSPAETTAR